MPGSIYCIFNKVDGKMYIGKSKQVTTRIRQHFNPKSRCLGLARAIKKHGSEAFAWEIFATDIPDDVLGDLESFYIWHLHTLAPHGYNFTGGGDGFDQNGLHLRSQNEEWKRKLIARNRAMAKDPKWLARNRQQATDPLWRANHAEGMKNRSSTKTWTSAMLEGGRKRSEDPEWKRKNAEGNRKKALDPEWIRKMTIIFIGRSKPVVCLDSGEIFLNAVEAGKAKGCSGSGITICCQGKTKAIFGNRWRYASQEESEILKRDRIKLYR